LLFILGEYSFSDISNSNKKTEKNLDFINKVFELTFELADSFYLFPQLKINYFYSFLIFISKILMNSKANSNLLEKINLKEKENISLKEYYNKLFLKINKLITIEDIFDLESIGILEMLKKLFSMLNLESEEFFTNFVNKKKLMPLHEKAQGMINVEKEFDINVCFPIDDDELNLSVKASLKKDLNNSNANANVNDEKGNSDVENSGVNDNINVDGDDKNLTNKKKGQENDEERITVDKNLYTPNQN